MREFFRVLVRHAGVAGLFMALVGSTHAWAASNVGNEITINSPANGQTVSGKSVAVNVTLGPDVWWDQLMVDGDRVLSGGGNFVWDSTTVANGTHTLMVRVFHKGGTIPLGTAYVTIAVNNSNGAPTPDPTSTPAPTVTPSIKSTPTATPIPSPSPTPIPTATPVATPTPSNTGAEITIDSPTSGQVVSGSAVLVAVTLGPDVWWDQLMIDGTSVLSGGGNFTWNSTTVSNGTHNLTVRAFQKGGTTPLGTASIFINVQNGGTYSTPTPDPTPTPPPPSSTQSATPTPDPTQTPAPSATPTPIPTGHFSMLTPGSSLPGGSNCANAVNADPEPEFEPWNENDGTGYNSNSIVSSPSYFYQYAGSQLGYPNADFQGIDGKYAGTTDDIMRWAACKWGVDEDWVRAQSEIETGMHQDCADMHGGSTCNENGDDNNPDGSCSGLPAGLSADGWPVTNSSGDFVGTSSVPHVGSYASWGVIQNKIACAEWYTWPMGALSTSWSEDYRWAKFRACMNGDVNARFNSTDYTNAVQNATSNPNGLYTGGNPKYLGSGETNLQYLAMGCILTHFSGGWYNSSAASYGDAFVSALDSHSWPGGLF
jgi:hypothetical protein